MFIDSVDGFGHGVLDNQMLFEMPRMYAAFFVAGALGCAFNLLVLLVERRYAHWSGR
jgi:NitT/TauT family transport system permease protein